MNCKRQIQDTGSILSLDLLTCHVFARHVERRETCELWSEQEQRLQTKQINGGN